MKRFILCALGAMALIGFSAGAAVAQEAEEQELHTMSQRLDDEAMVKGKASKLETLSQQFKVEPKVVETLRASKQGWGEITIRLGIAQELTKVDPDTYPTMTEALQKVGDLRAQKMGWGAIANSLGFKLGSIVSEVRHARNELRKVQRLEGGARAEEGKAKDVDRGDRVHKGDKLDKVEKMDRIEKMERVERPERVEKVERPEKPERIK